MQDRVEKQVIEEEKPALAAWRNNLIETLQNVMTVAIIRQAPQDLINQVDGLMMNLYRNKVSTKQNLSKEDLAYLGKFLDEEKKKPADPAESVFIEASREIIQSFHEDNGYIDKTASIHKKPKF